MLCREYVKTRARVHRFLRGSNKCAFFMPSHHIWKAKNDKPLAAPFAESLCSLCAFSKSNQNSNWGTNFSRWNHCICADMRCNVESDPSLNQKLRFTLLKNCFRLLILGGQIIVPLKDRKLRESTGSFHKMLKIPRGCKFCFVFSSFFDSLLTSPNYIKTKVILNCVFKPPRI